MYNRLTPINTVANGTPCMSSQKAGLWPKARRLLHTFYFYVLRFRTCTALLSHTEDQQSLGGPPPNCFFSLNTYRAKTKEVVFLRFLWNLYKWPKPLSHFGMKLHFCSTSVFLGCCNVHQLLLAAAMGTCFFLQVVHLQLRVRVCGGGSGKGEEGNGRVFSSLASRPWHEEGKEELLAACTKHPQHSHSVCEACVRGPRS